MRPTRLTSVPDHILLDDATACFVATIVSNAFTGTVTCKGRKDAPISLRCHDDLRLIIDLIRAGANIYSKMCWTLSSSARHLPAGVMPRTSDDELMKVPAL
jgi:hypothetical protein